MYKMLSTVPRDFIIIHRICILCNVFLKNMQFALAYSKKLLYIYEVSHDNVNLKNHFYRILKEDFEMKEKVVLAYSGGLDTTAIIPWLKEHFDYDVVCCCIDCGQGSELDGLQERAKLSGASKLYIEDLVDDFAENYIVPCVQANATYENKYLLGTSMARPAIAKRLVEIARKEGAVAICHGATGKGNDQTALSWASRLWLRTSRSSLHGV